MGVGAGVLSERARIFVGLDLGQSQDPTALSIVERAEVFPGEMNWVTYEQRRPLRFRVLYLERMLLGTPYPRVVERVRQVVRQSAQQGRCTLVMDATGLGTPVLGMMRAANLGCEIVPVLLTGGERESCANGVWHVPKRDLITGLQAMLDKRELGIPSKLPAARDLAREIAGMDVKISDRGRVSYGRSREGEHDDLVIATALACWRAQRKEPAFFGTRSLGLG